MVDALVIKAFLQSWGASETLNFFPGPQPISIERKHFGVLRNNEYVVCEKTDGVRYALFCKIIDGKKIVALINRALRVRYINLSGVPKSAYLGTIVDGELVDDKFIVYDGIEVYGDDIKQFDLHKRLLNINRFVSGILKSPKDSFDISLKQFSNLRSMKDYIETVVSTLKHKTDGFIFTPVRSPVRIGTHETMFKWKPRDSNTIDFKFKMNRNGTKWGLYIQEKGMLLFETELTRDQVPVELGIKEGDIVECQFMHDEYPKWWKPIHIRTDKIHPNNRRTYFNTLLNISENLQIHEFFNL